jgi:hypothetical protein
MVCEARVWSCHRCRHRSIPGLCREDGEVACEHLRHHSSPGQSRTLVEIGRRELASPGMDLSDHQLCQILMEALAILDADAEVAVLNGASRTIDGCSIAASLVSAYLMAVMIGPASNRGTRSMPRSASLKSAGAVPFRSGANPKSLPSRFTSPPIRGLPKVGHKWSKATARGNRRFA